MICMICIAILILSVILYYHVTTASLPADLAHDPANRWIKLAMTVNKRVGQFLAFVGVNKLQYNRRGVNKLAAAPVFSDDTIAVNDDVFDGIPVRVFLPKSKQAGLKPGIVYAHGGGFMLCSVDSHHALTRALALDTDTVVVSVNYRLAPEHVFPAAHDDVFKATVHFMTWAEEYGVDKQRVALAGDSAGGNLAISVSMALRDEHQNLKPKLQILINASCQYVDFQLPCSQQNDPLTSFFMSSRDRVMFFMCYALGYFTPYLIDAVLNNALKTELRKRGNTKILEYLDHKHIPKSMIPAWYKTPQDNEVPIDSGTLDQLLSQITNPYCSTLFAPDLSNLPEAYVIVSEYDLARDDAILFMKRLREAGVVVTEAYYKAIHDAIWMAFARAPAMRPEAGKQTYQDMVKFIKEKL